MNSSSNQPNAQPVHWADINAEKIVREKGSPQDRPHDHYTCASGITPSGTVHIGNFREIISVELVVRALRDRGYRARFIYSWDDYDVFRKVPSNVPNRKELEQYLRMPITLVPDPAGVDESYARANERELEALLDVVGVEPEYIYQAERYRSSRYAEGIRTALERRNRIRELLNEHRSEPLPEDWWPVSVFSGYTNKDTTTVLDWDGEWGLTYRCDETGNTETVDLRSTALAKLPWRIDWPMRWAYESVDFEPAGKDHHSEGGSFDTARGVVREIYEFAPPVTFQYDFLSIKGRGGKISSSSGEVIGLREVLEVYQPELVRYLFAGTRPNSEFAISFDLDVIKIYEDYDKCERIYFGLEEVNEKRRAKEARIYELSQVRGLPERVAPQLAFRHLCNQVQITDGDIGKALELALGAETLAGLSEPERRRLERRAKCALFWVRRFAPEDYRFELARFDTAPVVLEEKELSAVRGVAALIERRFDELNEKQLQQALYDLARELELEPKTMFLAMYRVLIGKEKGPRLAGFLKTIGRARCLEILNQYRTEKGTA